MNVRTILCSVALALSVLAPTAGADDQRALPPDQVYDYSCGRLGSDCEDADARAPRTRARGAVMRASGRAKARCARKTTTRRCARRGSARR